MTLPPVPTFKNSGQVTLREQEPTAKAKTPFRALMAPAPIQEEQEERRNIFELEEQKSSTDKKPQEYSQPVPIIAPLPCTSFFSQSTATAVKAVSALSPATATLWIEQLFDHMATELVCKEVQPGVQETSFVLDHPDMASSAFYGTRVRVESYSTAPKAFNIVLEASPQAVVLFHRHLPNLLKAFEQKELGFSVHRLEAYVGSDKRPAVQRKESVGKESEEREDS